MIPTIYISINGQEISGISIENNDATSTLRNEINDYQTVTGVSASLDSNNRLLLTALDGRNIEISIIGDGTRTGLAGGAGQIVIGGKLTLTLTKHSKLLEMQLENLEILVVTENQYLPQFWQMVQKICEAQ